MPERHSEEKKLTSSDHYSYGAPFELMALSFLAHFPNFLSPISGVSVPFHSKIRNHFVLSIF
jgi:hypothetical protein